MCAGRKQSMNAPTAGRRGTVQRSVRRRTGATMSTTVIDLAVMSQRERGLLIHQIGEAILASYIGCSLTLSFNSFVQGKVANSFRRTRVIA